MNLASSLLFAVIATAFAYTLSQLIRKVYGALKHDPVESACSCCSGKCTRCGRCGKQQ